MCNVHDRTHVILLLVVRAKSFPLYLEGLEKNKPILSKKGSFGPAPNSIPNLKKWVSLGHGDDNWSKTRCVTSQSEFKKKKNVKVRFLLMVPMCPPPNPTTHHFPPLIFTLSIFSLWPAHSLHFFSFFFSFSHTVLPTFILSTDTSTPPTPPFPPSFSGKIIGKLLWTYKHIHILFLR